MGDNDVVEESMAAESQIDTARERTPSSIESTPSPEPDLGREASQEAAPPQKRKGGRKPIYATSEERKQRNRQAQAAFRERRSEYIKQLEATIKQNEDSLTTLQQSHRSAADECLMLRYKNSLLERILLERGIDVQAELSMKTGSPNFQHPAANIPNIPPPQPPIQRTATQRHQARRSGQFLPKLAPTSSAQDTGLQRSPQGHPTPSSHASSPMSLSARSPTALQQNAKIPPTSARLSQSQQRPFSNASRTSQPSNPPSYQPAQMSPTAQRPGPPLHRHSASGVSNRSASSQHSRGTPLSTGPVITPIDSMAPQMYPNAFQKHIDQLEHEYATQQTQPIFDPSEAGDISDLSSDHLRGQYPPQSERRRPDGEYYHNVPHGQQQPFHPTRHSQSLDGHFPPIDEVVDPDDPMLDADPFGLSASMHYPTSYSFDPTPQRPLS